MSIAAIITRGYGSFGSIADIVTRGYSVLIIFPEGEELFIVPTERLSFILLAEDTMFVTPMETTGFTPLTENAMWPIPAESVLFAVAED